MEEDNVCQIRKSTRELLNWNRKALRGVTIDSRRSIASSSETANNIRSIANKLKTKAPISPQELSQLKNNLLDNEGNIKIVFSTHGALRGIIRELSGTDIQKQCEAAGCCCNLALGDSRGCMALAKAAGSYLVTCVDSFSCDLAVNCIWALGNLAGSDTRVAEVLIAQGAAGKLIHTLGSTTNENVREAILYALTHFVYRMRDDLSQEYLHQLVKTLTNVDNNLPKWRLLSLASCHHEFITAIDECHSSLINITNFLPVSLQNHLLCKHNYYCCDFIYVLRSLANICIGTQSSDFMISSFRESNLVSEFKRVLILGNEVVNSALYWLLGNVMNFSTDCLIKNEFFNELCR